jgi:hypothetical protein
LLYRFQQVAGLIAAVKVQVYFGQQQGLELCLLGVSAGCDCDSAPAFQHRCKVSPAVPENMRVVEAGPKNCAGTEVVWLEQLHFCSDAEGQQGGQGRVVEGRCELDKEQGEHSCELPKFWVGFDLLLLQGPADQACEGVAEVAGLVRHETDAQD